MKDLKLVIFDMDGLLFDTEVFYCDRIETYCKKKGVKVDISAIHKVIGTSNPVNMELFNQSEYSNEYAKQIMDEAHLQSLEYVVQNGAPLKKGALELVHYLKEKGIKMVVATSTRIEISAPILKHGHIYEHLDFVITGKEVKRGKPYPDIFLKALSRSGFKAEEALILEDSINGGLAAKAAKIPYIIVPDINAPTREVEEAALSIQESLLNVLDQIKNAH